MADTPIPPILHDSAKDVLTDAPMSDDEKATCWDHWHDARNVRDLSTRLSGLDIPSDVRESLIEAKRLSEPEAPIRAALAPVMTALNHLTTIDPAVLDLAESNPTVLKALATAVTKE